MFVGLKKLVRIAQNLDALKDLQFTGLRALMLALEAQLFSRKRRSSFPIRQ